MPIHGVSTLTPTIFFLLMTAAGSAIAQPKQVVKDTDVGVRLSIPKYWTWESRRSDIFINCAPDKDDRGRPGCYFTVRKVSVPADQRTITDADRAKWKGWVSANGMRTILSARDFKVTRFPAYEIVARSGTKSSDPRMRRVMILVPGAGAVFDVSFIAMLAEKDYDQYNPAFGAALETLAPAK